VIIFERIKEEMRKGDSQLLAIKDGFSNAFASLFDSNITLVLTCLILSYYGTGPVRGFAVTLMIGMIMSLFTSVFVAKTILETVAMRTKFNIIPVSKMTHKRA
jgi:protein-export membrane protein SecD